MIGIAEGFVPKKRVRSRRRYPEKENAAWLRKQVLLAAELEARRNIYQSMTKREIKRDLERRTRSNIALGMDPDRAELCARDELKTMGATL